MSKATMPTRKEIASMAQRVEDASFGVHENWRFVAGNAKDMLRSIADALADSVVVPREPTLEMIEAVCALKLKRILSLKDGAGIRDSYREEYAAMLAAAKGEGNG